MRSYRYGEKGKEESSEIQAKEYGVGIGSAAGLPQKEEADYRLNLTFTIVSHCRKFCLGFTIANESLQQKLRDDDWEPGHAYIGHDFLLRPRTRWTSLMACAF